MASTLDDLNRCLRELDATELAERPALRRVVERLRSELSRHQKQTRPTGELPAPARAIAAPLHAKVHRACALLHGDLSRPWTVEELARSVGLSRAALASRFTEVLGESPMRYLTRCRLEWAAAELHRSDASLAEIAWEAGYRSEFAFGRAFKRHHGMPPGLYRQHVRPVALQGTLARAA